MYILSILFAAYLYLNFFKDKKKLFANVTLQNSTEEAEAMVFSMPLYQDETEGVWQEKIQKMFDLAESRRAFNNERLMSEVKSQKELLAQSDK